MLILDFEFRDYFFTSGVKLLFCSLILFLSGCASPKAPVLEPGGLWPQNFVLEDASGNKLGYGVPLASDVLVAPDHIWQKSGALFVGDEPIEVLARDFRHDVFFFRVPGRVFLTPPQWSIQPPGVGETVWWGTEEVFESGKVYSARAEFNAGNFEIEGLMLLDTAVDVGASGQALLNPETYEIQGVLVATDQVAGQSYFARSDLILGLAAEYLDL